jgi:hypothetical protein
MYEEDTKKNQRFMLVCEEKRILERSKYNERQYSVVVYFMMLSVYQTVFC